MTERLLTAPERYVANVELAHHLGVSTSTIKRWLRAGCPSHNWGMKRTRRYRITEVEAWLEQRENTDRARILSGDNHNAERLTPARPESTGK